MEWQFVGDDIWIFGEMVRGFVRNKRAEIWYDEESTSPEGGWHWIVYDVCYPGDVIRGMAGNRAAAIDEAEKKMGIA